MSKHHGPNDHRSNVKNPNNPAYQSDRGNRTSQGHANIPPPPPSTPDPKK